LAAIQKKKITKNFKCSECDDKLKKVRHCPFINKVEWETDIKYIIPFSTGEKCSLDECPTGFVKINNYLQIFFDIYTAIESGLPIKHGYGLLDLPNIYLVGAYIVAEELNYVEENNASKR